MYFNSGASIPELVPDIRGAARNAIRYVGLICYGDVEIQLLVNAVSSMAMEEL